MIKAIKDKEYIKECIENRIKLNLGEEEILRLTIATKDEKYIKYCIEHGKKYGLSHIGPLILNIGDPEFTKSCIIESKKLKLSSSEVKLLVENIEDLEFTKSCIINRKKIGLSVSDVKSLIASIKDLEIMKSCITNRKKIGLSESDILEIIRETKDPEFIKNSIKDIKYLGVAIPAEVILLTGDIKFIEDCEKAFKLKQEDIKKIKMFNNKSHIKLLSNMTIGVEIETEGRKKDNSIEIKRLLEDTEWRVVRDSSLVNGSEIVSPVLTGNMEKQTDEIKNICAILNGIQQNTSERCGGHIHIGADYLKNKQDFVNLIEIWSNAEKVLYTICNKKGEIPREGISEYAEPISKKIENAIKAGTINLKNEEDLEEFVNEIYKVQGERYSGINFCNIGKKDKNTIEFRLPNGTIDPNTWIENINLFGGIVKKAHELSVIQSKTIEQRTEREKNILYDFKKIQTEKDENKIAEALIDLCIEPEDKEIYMDRYTTNKLLLDISLNIKKAVIDKISTSKIGIKVFRGKSAVTVSDYMQYNETLKECNNKSKGR